MDGYVAMPRYRGNMSERKVSPFCRHEVWNLGLGWQGGNGQEQY